MRRTPSRLLAAALVALGALPAWAGTTPYRVQADTASDSAFTVSWVTTTSETGYVEFGTSANSLTNVAYDSLGSTASSRTHCVVVGGLSSGTAYRWKIVSGGVEYGDASGAAFQTTTGSSLILIGSRLASGQVLAADGSAAADALVHVTLRDADSAGSAGDSQTRTVRADSSGNWIFLLEAFRTGDLGSEFTVSSAGDSIVVAADGGASGTASGIVDSSYASTSPTTITTTLVAPGAPVVTSVSPQSASNGVAANVTIGGSNLLFATSAALDDASATALSSFVVVSDSAATATIPAGVAPGSYDVRVTSPDGTNAASAQQFTVAIPPSITEPALAGWTVGVAYGHTIAASDGVAPLNWSVTAGTPPSGLTLSSGGVLSGTPTTAGTSAFTVQVTDAAGATASKDLTLSIAGAVTAPSGLLPGWTAGRPYGTSTLTTTGGTDPVSWSVTGLPPGLSSSGSGRSQTVSGTPSSVGSYTITATATDAAGSSASQTFTMIVAATISQPGGTLPDWTAGASYGSRTITTSGGTEPVTWTTAGLPPGVTASATGRTLTLSGTPTAAGAYSIDATATDTAGSSATATFGVTIHDALTQPSGTLPDWTSGRDYGSRTITTTGGTDAVTWTTAGLPPGVSASGSARTLTVSGTPTATGAYSIVATATDAAGSSATRTFGVVVSGPLTSLAGSLPDWTAGRDYGSRAITTTGGTDPVAWSATGVPPGLVTSSSGRTLSISGTPTTAGTYSVAVAATDAAGSSSSQTFAVVVSPSLGAPIGALPDWTQNRDYGTRTVTTTGGTAPVSWSVTGLPPGLAATPNARTVTVTGTPVQSGTFTVTAAATDAAGASASSAWTVVVGAPPTSPSGTLPDWTVGRPYGSGTLTTTGGTDPISWTATGLPAGLTAAASGRTLTVSGTPTTAGSYTVGVSVLDAAGATSSRSITVVMNSPLTSLAGSLPDWTVGHDWGVRSVTTTGGTDAVTWTTTGLPPGATATQNGRTLTVSGTPTATGAYSIVATATDAAGSSAAATFAVTIHAALTQPAGTFPDWTAGRDYGSRTVTTTGGTDSVSWTASGLPPGTTTSASGRTLTVSGTPTASGAYTIVATATDAAGSSATASFGLTIRAAITQPSGTLPDWTAGRDYGSRTVTTTGGTDPVTWSAAGLPPGLVTSPSARTLTISGTPTTAGTYSVAVAATDAAGSSASQTFAIVVSPSLTSPAGTLPDWTLGRDYGTRTVTTTGGTSPVSWSVAGLPPGLAATANGRTVTVDGAPTQAGSFTVTATATDFAGATAATSWTVVVSTAPTAPTGSLPDWTAGQSYGNRAVTTSGGTDPLTFTAAGLPPGTTATASGRTLTVSGTPTTAGTYSVGVSVADAAGATSTATFAVTVHAALTQPGGALPDWTAGRSYGTRAVTTTGGTDAVTWTTAGLPPGVTASGSGRTLTVSGTPTTAGAYSIDATATDATGSSATATFVVTVHEALTQPSGTLPDWTAGRDYGSRTITTTGGTDAVTWTAAGLPPGVTAIGSGRTLTVSGTPTTAGGYSVLATATDAAGSSASRTFAVTVNASLTALAGSLPDWTSGRDYGSRTVTTTGGTDPVTWSATGLPPGLVASSSARTLTISGTPTTAGTYSVAVAATDAAGSSSSQTFAIVVGEPLTSPAGALPDWTQGRAYGTRAITTTGGTAPVSWSVSGLPSGLAATPNGRTLSISGTPSTAGAYTVQTTVTDAAGSAASASFTVTVNLGLSAPAGTLPDWTVGQAYGTHALTTTGGTDPIAWTATGLPPGLTSTASARTLTVSGTPTTVGTYSVSVSVEDAAGAMSSRSLTVVVSAPLTSLAGTLPDWTVGRSYGTRTLTTTGGTDPVTWTTTGLPSGLTASASGRMLTVSGTPDTAGTYALTATATDAAGSSSSRLATIVVNAALSSPSGSLPDWTAGRDYGSHALTTSGGTDPIDWSVTGLPAGLIATPSGRTLTVSGLPTAAGTYSVVTTVTDGTGSSTTRAVTMVVNAAVTAASGTLPDWTQGRSYGSRVLTTTGGTDPVSWNVTGLPAGLTTSASGRSLTVSGTPTTTGTYTVAVAATDAAGSSATRTIALAINAPVTQPTGTLPDWTVSRDYGTHALTTTGGTDPVTWSVSGLPAGLLASPNGRTLNVVGTPSQSGGFIVVATATDAAGSVASASFTINVNAGLTSPSGTLPDWTVGRAYGTRSVTTTGGTTPVVWTTSGLPAGLTATPNGRTVDVSGTPTAAGTFLLTLTATDAAGATAARTLTVVVNSAVASPSGALPDWTAGRDYGTRVLSTTGGTDPVAWTVTGLPAGLSATANGRSVSITGVPSATGTFTVAATATDAAGSSASRNVTVVVNAALSGAAGTLPDWTVDRDYTARTLTVTGGTDPVTWNVSGLPAGLSGSSQGRTFTIAGTPTAAGSYIVLATASDPAGSSSMAAWPVTIHGALATPGGTLPDWTVGFAYGTHVLSSGGGTEPMTWNVTGLPPGLTATPSSAPGRTLTVAGTPTTTGAFDVSAVVTDGAGATSNLALRVVVNERVSIVDTSLPDWTSGRPTSHTMQSAGGTPALRWELLSGLPPGLSFDPATGTYSGVPTPAQDHDFPVRFRVTDTAGSTDERAFTIHLNDAAAISTATIDFASVGAPYAFALERTAGSGTAPFTWTISSPGAPAWLAIDAATGALSSSQPPDAAGAFDFDVTLADAAGSTAVRTYRLETAGVVALDGAAQQTYDVAANRTRLLLAFDGLRGSTVTLKLRRPDGEPLAAGVRLVRADDTEWFAPGTGRVKVTVSRRSTTVATPALGTTGRYFVSVEALPGTALTVAATPGVRYGSKFRGVLSVPAGGAGDFRFAAPAGADAVVVFQRGRHVVFDSRTNEQTSQSVPLDAARGPRLAMRDLEDWGEYDVRCAVDGGAAATLRYTVTVAPRKPAKAH